jgi:hypothetical protein
MSTTPSPSEVSYTIVGERSQRDGRPITALVLNRGGRQTRAEFLERLLQAGCAHVLVILGPTPHYDVEQLSSRISDVRFLLLPRPVTIGEQINMAMKEVDTPYALTIWSDMEVSTFGERAEQQLQQADALCAVPLIRSERGETIPSVIAPAFFRSTLRTIPSQPGTPLALSLYPFADAGIYNREKFEASGGFDPEIFNSYWQRMEYGFRAFLWGERIATVPAFRLSLTRPLPAEDTTPDPSYARFHLKSLAVRFSGDEGRIPGRQLIPLVLRSGLSVPQAVDLFRSVRRWVQTHRFRFVQDARRVTELWEIE